MAPLRFHSVGLLVGLFGSSREKVASFDARARQKSAKVFTARRLICQLIASDVFLRSFLPRNRGAVGCATKPPVHVSAYTCASRLTEGSQKRFCREEERTERRRSFLLLFVLFLKLPRCLSFSPSVANECRSTDASAGLTRPDGCSWYPGTPLGTRARNEQNHGLNRQHARLDIPRDRSDPIQTIAAPIVCTTGDTHLNQTRRFDISWKYRPANRYHSSSIRQDLDSCQDWFLRAPGMQQRSSPVRFELHAQTFVTSHDDPRKKIWIFKVTNDESVRSIDDSSVYKIRITDRKQ